MSYLCRQEWSCFLLSYSDCANAGHRTVAAWRQAMCSPYMSACYPPAGGRHNDNDERRGENVMNASDTILHRGLFTTVLLAALNRSWL
jgi:hypothetical protein